MASPWGSTLGVDDVIYRGDRCRCLLCPTCRYAAQMREREKLIQRFERGGVVSVSMLTLTVDPARFPDPDHLKRANIVSRAMELWWRLMPSDYLARWPKPFWACGYEWHQVQAYLHGHVLVPAPEFPGLAIGRLPRDVLDTMREWCIKHAGRMQYGWGDAAKRRSVTVCHPLKSAAGYVSKTVGYALKGVESLPDRLRDVQKVPGVRYSGAVTDLDPKCEARRVRERVKAERERERRLWCVRQAQAAKRAGDREACRMYRRIAKYGYDPARQVPPAPVVRAPARRVVERLSDCCGTGKVYDSAGCLLAEGDLPVYMVAVMLRDEIAPPDGVDERAWVRDRNLGSDRPTGWVRGPRSSVLGIVEACRQPAAASGLPPSSEPLLHVSGGSQPAIAGVAGKSPAAMRSPLYGALVRALGRVESLGRDFPVDGQRARATRQSEGGKPRKVKRAPRRLWFREGQASLLLQGVWSPADPPAARDSGPAGPAAILVRESCFVEGSKGVERGPPG